MKPVAKQSAWLIILALSLVGLSSCSKSLPTGAGSLGPEHRSAGFHPLGQLAPLTVAGEAIVVLDPEVKPDDFLNDNGLEQLTVVELGSTTYRLVRQRGETLDAALVENLNRNSGVKHAEPNYLLENPEGEGENMAFDHGDCRGAVQYDNQDPINQIHLSEALGASPTDGAGVRVAILDTGAQDAHEAFKGKLDSWSPGFDVDGRELLVGDSRESADNVDEDGDGQKDEASGHGTHVSGIVHMVAPAASLYSVRVLNDDGWGTVTSVVQGIRYAVDVLGVQVINMSLGLETSSPFLEDAVEYATSRGVQIVASAGNQASQVPQYPASYNGVLSVTGVDSKDVLWKYANYNSAVGLSAPCVDIVSAIPGAMLHLDSNYAVGTGTSMAAPFVAGAVALTMSTLGVPALDAGRIVQMSSTNVDDRNPEAGGLMGHGRLDVAAALGK